MNTTRTWAGPEGFKLTADRREVCLDDPGAGTPLIVSKGKASATLCCALDAGELHDDRDGYLEVPGRVQRWLESVADEATDWVYGASSAPMTPPAADFDRHIRGDR